MASNELDSKALDAAYRAYEADLMAERGVTPWTLRESIATSVRAYLEAAALPAPAVPVATEPVEAVEHLTAPVDDFYKSFDAVVWAKAWLKIVSEHPEVPTDEGTMIGWFANALMRGYDEHAWRNPAPPAGEPTPAAGPEGGEEDARSQFWRAVCAEIDHAYAKHGREPWGRHEFYGVMKEEVDEVWDAIKTNEGDAELAKEIVQVAAMCLRYIETGDRYQTLRAAVELSAPRNAQENK